MRWQSRVTPDRAVLVGLFLTAAVYCRDLQYSFVLDDSPLIFTNENLASWRNWKILFRTHIFSPSGPSIPVSFPVKPYRPIYMLWLMINEQLFGLIVPWWHLTSLLLHICAIYLAYQLGLKILKDGWTAALGALLFAFHPIHVESVAYVSASTDLLVTVFVLISFLSYCRFREPNASPAYLAVSLFTAGLAMLSKETAAMLPFLLSAYEALREIPPGRQRRWTRFIWVLPFFAIVAAYAVVRTVLFGNLGQWPGFSRWAALADAPLVLLAYLRNLSWPRQLSFYYPVEWVSQWTLWKSFLLALVMAIGAFLWKRYQAQPGIQLQFLWTAILFVPAVTAVAVFAKEDWVHDRHMYLVSVPFCLILADGLASLKFPRNACLIVSTLILALLFCETTIQVPRFTDENTLYENALRVAPRNEFAHRYYAFALWSNGDYEGAFREFRTTLQLAPGGPFIYGSYADALAEAGHDEEAAREYAAALHWSPKSTPYRAFLLYRLATIETKHSQSAEGESHLREALQIAPQTRGYHAMLAQALRQQGRTQEADQEMRLEMNLRNAAVHEAFDP